MTLISAFSSQGLNLKSALQQSKQGGGQEMPQKTLMWTARHFQVFKTNTTLGSNRISLFFQARYMQKTHVEVNFWTSLWVFFSRC